MPEIGIQDVGEGDEEGEGEGDEEGEGEEDGLRVGDGDEGGAGQTAIMTSSAQLKCIPEEDLPTLLQFVSPQTALLFTR